MADFLNEIGIEVTSGKFEEEEVLPGILINDGKIVVDESKLLYPSTPRAPYPRTFCVEIDLLIIQ